MKVKTIPAMEARTQFGRIMKEVHGGQVRVSAQEFQRETLHRARRRRRA